jgi:hypothetical protein
LLPSLRKDEPKYDFTADDVRDVIASGDKSRMREISQYFYGVSGIYKRLLYLFASMPNFYYLITPHMFSEKIPEKKLLKDFWTALEFVDGLNIEINFPLINLALFKDGIYFGYLRNDKETPVIQTLPSAYCKSQYKTNNRFVIEFNFEYFDREFLTTEEKTKALKQFPKEFQKEYNRYKSGAKRGLNSQWEILDTDLAVCFKMPDEIPFFLPIIVDLIELREAKNIELSKDKLQLFQLLIQKLPINKEGELIFGLPEARELHKNALKMLENNGGIDVLTTFAEVDMMNIKETRDVQKDNLLKSERSVFNEAGVSKMMFATEGNISLSFSIQTNEAILRFVWPQFCNWLTHATNLAVGSGNKYSFEVWMPPVTIYNEKEMEERYRKQATHGYAKLLPGIITGIKQSTLLNLMKFENDYLRLNDMMEPLKSSHTMSGKEEKKSGRPEKPIEEKEDTTLGNEEGKGGE